MCIYVYVYILNIYTRVLCIMYLRDKLVFMYNLHVSVPVKPMHLIIIMSSLLYYTITVSYMRLNF